MQKKVLILYIDRDDDIGQKLNKSGPIYGRSRCFELAGELGLADPKEIDTNSIFKAVSIYDSLKERREATIAVLTGDPAGGFEADEKISKQLSQVLNKKKADEAIIVSDGSEDEQILPVIRSHIPILSVERVIVRQSEQLESAFFKLKDFLQDSLKDKRVATMLFGLPGITMLLFGIFGPTGYRIVLGGIGIYMIIKGFKLEKQLLKLWEEIREAFTTRILSFFFYAGALAIFAVALKSGFDATIGVVGWAQIGAAFLKGSIYLLFLSALTALLGKAILEFPRKGLIVRYLSITVLLLALMILVSEASLVILQPEIGLTRLFGSIALGAGLVAIVFVFERYLKK